MDLFTFSVRKVVMLFCFLLVSIFQVADATNIQSTGAGGVWNNTASWLPAQVPVAGDVVTINSGSPITVTALAACATITINSGGVLTLNGGSITISGSFSENGTLNCMTGFNVLGAGSFTLANNNNAFLMIGDANGITTSPTASGSIQNTGGRTFPATANYVYDGTVNQNTGNGLPTTINGGGSLVINNTGAIPNNVVTLASTSTIQNVTLQAGFLSLNGKTITVSGTILNSGGDLSSTPIANGGTFNIQGATITGPTTFYNLSCNSSNSTITTSGLSAPLIDGTLLITGSVLSGTNSLRYGQALHLSYCEGSPNNKGLEWNADLTTPPTIGVTQGYPYNVFINSGSDFYIVNQLANGNDGATPRGLAGNLTTSELTMVDWNQYYGIGAGPFPLLGSPLLLQTGSFTVGGNMICNSGGNVRMVVAGAGGPFIIKGSLTINGAGASLYMHTMSSLFSVGAGITINNGTIFMGNAGGNNVAVTGDIDINGGTINDSSGIISLTGNWNKTGGTFNTLGGTINFNSTIGNQTITTNTVGGETFYNLTINNTAGNIVLANNINVNNQLAFTKGLIVTNANTVSVASSGSIIGAAQSTGWVDGNLQEGISATTPYLFAVGDAAIYAPATLTFSSVTTAGNVTVSTNMPFTSTPGLASFALSQTAYANRYWTLTENSGTFGNYTGAFNYGTTSLIGGATIGTLETGVYNGTTWTYPSSSGAGTTVTATSIVPLGGSPTSVALAICAPPTIYNVTGTGSYCVGGTPVGLDNSQIGINYQLQTAGPTNVGVPVAGTGAAISFGNQTVGTYTVIATNAATLCTNNMAGSAVITISGAPSIVTPPATQSVCFSSSAQNAALSYNTPVNAPTNYSITWNPATLAAGFTNIASTPLPPVGTDIQISVPAGIVSNTYSGTIIVTNAGGCTSASNTFTLTVNPLPTISGFVSGSVCFSSSVQNYNLAYTGTTGTPTTYSITWNAPTSLVNVATTPLPLSPIPISIPANASAISNTGTIYVTNANGCTSTGNIITIDINILPTPTFTSEPGTNACLNTAVTYATQSGQTNYAWTIPGTAGVDYTIVSGGSSSDYTTTLKWLTSGSKIVSINYTNTNNCAAASPVSSTPVTISAGVNASNLTIPSTTPVCAGVNNSTVTVNSTTLPSNTYTVTYNLSAPNTATGLTATMNFTGGTGSFIVPAMYLNTAGSTSITITDLQNGSCNTSGLSTVGSILVNAVNPTFITQPGATACIDSNVVYTTQPGQSNYVWSFSGTANSDYSIVSGGTSTDNSVTLQWLNTNTSKTVTVNYTNTNSCTATNATSSTPTKIIICNILPLYIPSGFAPNGQNPLWHIINSEDYPNMQVQIFDRWGHEVFECRGYTAWDGTFQGQNLSTGSYAYVINVNDDRYKQILRGTVTIIR